MLLLTLEAAGHLKHTVEDCGAVGLPCQKGNIADALDSVVLTKFNKLFKSQALHWAGKFRSLHEYCLGVVK